MNAEKFYITTAISYPNGKPHIGHAYEAVAADAIARFHRLQGKDVCLLTGTDEHGLKMVQTARGLGKETMALATEMSDHFREMCAKLNISIDRFCRTTDPHHHAASQEIWRRLEANGDLYLDRYEGWYSVRDEAFYEESELKAGEDGVKLSPQGTPVEWTVEESWFFHLSKYQEPLLKLYAENPGWVRPESRLNETVKFVEGGLRDLSISRTSFDWGVKVPGSPDHVMYVWLDALTTYISGIGFPDEGGDFAKYWPADLHLIGKDIVRFHTVYWPAFLMAAGLPLPKAIFGHGFILARDGQKMSKSAGNSADPLVLAERYGVDQLRYFFLREVSFGNDGSWSEEAIVTRCNADLANNFGNLAQRSLSMIAKNCGGIVPLCRRPEIRPVGILSRLEVEWLLAPFITDNANMPLQAALGSIWEAMSDANQWFAEQEPWAVRKTEPEKADSILYWTAEIIRRLAILVQWAIPEGAGRILDLLGQADDQRNFAALASNLQAGLELPAPTGVFPRLEMHADEE